MLPSVRAEYDPVQEMVADTSEQSVPTAAASDNSQLPVTAEVAELMESAIKNNDLATVNHLLARGADPNIRCQCGHTPLFLAIGKQKGQEGIVRTLLDYGRARIFLSQNVRL